MVKNRGTRSEVEGHDQVELKETLGAVRNEGHIKRYRGNTQRKGHREKWVWAQPERVQTKHRLTIFCLNFLMH